MDLSGKHGLVLGVANKRSIAWAIAQKASEAGASLALTYQGERLEENVRELAGTLKTPSIVLPCDVTSDEQIAATFAAIDEKFGGLDFVLHGAAFAPKEALTAPFVETTRDAFRMALDISAYSLVALARGAAPLMSRRGGGSIVTLTYLGSERVFPNYNVMAVAKSALECSVRYLASDLGAQNIRVNAISAGPVRTLASAGIPGFTSILQVYRDRAPLRRNVDVQEVADAALFLLGSGSRGMTGETMMVDAGFSVMGMDTAKPVASE
jgi:enoyl-[acyl-carrier protein] reductase I